MSHSPRHLTPPCAWNIRGRLPTSPCSVITLLAVHSGRFDPSHSRRSIFYRRLLVIDTNLLNAIIGRFHATSNAEDGACQGLTQRNGPKSQSPRRTSYDNMEGGIWFLGRPLNAPPMIPLKENRRDWGTCPSLRWSWSAAPFNLRLVLGTRSFRANPMRLVCPLWPVRWLAR